MKSIRKRMMLTLISSTIVVFGILFYLSQMTLAKMPAITKKQYSEIVAARSDEVSGKLAGMLDQLKIVSQSPIIRSMNKEAIKEYLPSLVLPSYRNMTIAYPDGSAWSTLNQDLNIIKQQQYQDIFVDHKEFSISQPFISDFVYEPNKPIITMSHKIVNNNDDVVGIVNFVVPIEFLNQIVSELELSEGGYGWIANRDGMIVAHKDSSFSFHKQLSDIITDSNQKSQFFSKPSGSFEYEKLDGEKMIAFYDEIEDSPGWVFAVSISESSIYDEVNQYKQTVFMSLGVALIIVFLYSYFFSHKLTKPISEFTDLFHQAAGGNLNVRANEDYRTEFGLAATTFNTMLERIKILTYQDITTYLYNYNGFLLELPQKLKSMMGRNLVIAVVIISIDDFKKINSINGYLVGDEVLRQFSERLLKQLHGEGLAARFFGDEFILVIGGRNAAEVEAKVKQLWEICSGEVTVGENSFILHTSIGASMLADYETSIDTTIHEATVAKLIVKKEGGNHFRFYNLDLDLVIKLEQKIEMSLFYALPNNEFHLVYQPIVDVRTNRIIATESLLRWNHPDFKSISIQKVIQQAEQNGMIVEIGKWILKEACIQNKKWQMEGYPDLVISVNVSAIQFEQDNFVEMVRQILEETQMNPNTLELEITEHIAMDNVYEKLHKMSALQKMGVRIALDDFGTGYSSLAYFSRFPIDTLKIDRSFIVGLFSDEHSKNITTTIINLAKSTHISTTAEGVETKEQLEYLKELDCDKIQGYYFSKPTNSEVISDMLKKQNK